MNSPEDWTAAKRSVAFGDGRATNLTALRLAPERNRFPDWVAVVGLVFCLVMAASLKPVTIGAGLGLLAFGLVFRSAIRKAASPKPGQ